MTQAVRNFSDFRQNESAKAWLRALARDLAIRGLSLGKRTGQGEWIRFPFWHHVFDDERLGFKRQLDWMKCHGDFIGFSDAVSLLASRQKIGGRYFCLSFDDGFKNVLANAAPILDQAGAKAMVYLATDYVGETDETKLRGFYDHGRLLLEFMDWRDAATWRELGHEVGSHSRSHALFKSLNEAWAGEELLGSKLDIEKNLGAPCLHFCVPFGVAGLHFDKGRDPMLAKQAGYVSFASGHRGRMEQDGDPYFILRDHLLANAGDHQLRYFLGD